MKENRKVVGALGESVVIDYLKKKRYQILEQNYRCKCGEVDIIAKDGEYIVFIEVKTRKDNDYGTPSEAVNYYKQKRIVQVAKYYMILKGQEFNARFDVIEVFGTCAGGKLLNGRINHIKNAFWA
mgnify:CR=1 FL=1